MADIFTDDFTRADSTDLGANWSEDAGAWSIAGNTLQCDSGGAAVVARTTTTAHAAIADVEVRVTLVDAGSADGGPIARQASTTYYEGDAYTGFYELYRYPAGTALASGAITLTAGVVAKLKVTGSGATVTCIGTYNGTEEFNYGDTNAARITAAGQCGVKSYTNANNFDNFAVDDLGGAAATNSPLIGGGKLVNYGRLLGGGRLVAMVGAFARADWEQVAA